MPWYWDSATHTAIEADGARAAVLNTQVMVGAHDLIPGQRWYGPYATQAAAQAAGAKLPTSPFTGPDLSGLTGPVIDSVPSLSSIEGYFVRGAEIIAGVVLMAIAANAILRSSTGVDVGAKVKSGATRAAVALAK